jgi:hypothetical protein
MRYILICEAPFPSRKVPGRALHVKAMTRDEVIRKIKLRWSAIEQTLTILDGASNQIGAAGKHYPVPIDIEVADMVFWRFTLNVEGKMDFETSRYKMPCLHCGAEGQPCVHRLPLQWVDPDHQCGPSCMLRPYQRVSQTVFGGTQ